MLANNNVAAATQPMAANFANPTAGRSSELAPNPVVSLSGVKKNFGPLTVLDGVSLEIKKGQMVAIVGRSGSGKSTLLRCMNGLERIDTGSISVCGHEVHHLIGGNLRELRRDVGIVFQSYNLFPHLTVARNITLALSVVKNICKDETEEICRRVLALVGLSDKAHCYPEQLSGGQSQRVAIARSLALSPQLMLFDEVTSALDPELTGEVLKVMEDLSSEGMTMVLVTHEMGFARRVADIVVFMHHGKVWEIGPPEQLFNSPRTPEFAQFISSGL